MGIFNKPMKTIISAAGLALLTGLAGMSGSVMASTPDGETPANEGVCDMLRVDGVTKGLYGLCVAYCEAQDLDEFGDKDPPNNKILSNYNRKKQAGDPGMPCVRAPCPCWSPAELNAIATNIAGGIVDCSVNTDAGFAEIKTIQVPGINGTAQRARADLTRDPGVCRYLDRTGSPISLSFDVGGDITNAQMQQCFNDVVQACTP